MSERPIQCDQKKSPNAYKSYPKMISLEKLKNLTSLQKLPKNGEDWGKLIVANGFKKLPKVQNIAQSGHSGSSSCSYLKKCIRCLRRHSLPSDALLAKAEK